MEKEIPDIRTNRFLLRRFSDDDLENVYNGLSHPDVIRYNGVSYDSLEATKEQMQFFADLEENGTGQWFAVCSPDNQTFYGAGGLNGLSREHKKAEIGFWLLPEHQGQGIMTEVVPIICDYGFTKLDLHRIEGWVETDNTACKKAMAKLNFTREGTLQDCEIKNGRFISLDIFAMLRPGQS